MLGLGFFSFRFTDSSNGTRPVDVCFKCRVMGLQQANGGGLSQTFLVARHRLLGDPPGARGVGDMGSAIGARGRAISWSWAVK